MKKATFAQTLQGVRQGEVKNLIAQLQKLKRNLGGGILGEELEHLAIVLAQVAEVVLPHVHGAGDHGARYHDGACT